MRDRIARGWSSSSLGVAAGGAWVYLIQAAPPECAAWLQGWQTWLPGVLFAVWGLFIKGPAKVDKNGNVKM